MSRSLAHVTLFASAAMLISAGCGAVADKAAEKATEEAVERIAEANGGGDVDINTDDGTFSMETDDGKMVIDDEGNMVIESDEGTMTFETGQELPDDFPDVPLPDELAIESTSRMDSGDGTVAFSVTGKVDRDPAEVFDAAIRDLEGAGYESAFRSDATTDGAFSGTTVMSKGDTDQITVNVFEEDGVAYVQVLVTNS